MHYFHESKSLMGPQEFKESAGNPYDTLSWKWLLAGIASATLLGIAISYVIVRVGGM